MLLSYKIQHLTMILFQLPYSETFDKTLVFAIFDYDRFSKHDQVCPLIHRGCHYPPPALDRGGEGAAVHGGPRTDY